MAGKAYMMVKYRVRFMFNININTFLFIYKYINIWLKHVKYMVRFMLNRLIYGQIVALDIWVIG